MGVDGFWHEGAPPKRDDPTAHRFRAPRPDPSAERLAELEREHGQALEAWLNATNVAWNAWQRWARYQERPAGGVTLETLDETARRARARVEEVIVKLNALRAGSAKAAKVAS